MTVRRLSRVVASFRDLVTIAAKVRSNSGCFGREEFAIDRNLAVGLARWVMPRRAPGMHGCAAASESRRQGPYAALDLGTNNCRLLIARPTAEGFRVIDAFSRIVRLGEGLSQTGRLSEAAIERTIGALTICRDKMRMHGVARARLIATEACRSAANGEQFLAQVRERVGIQLEIVDRETEARLAAAGCGALADRDAQSIVLFDIGGGSSEIVWLSGGDSGGDANGAADPAPPRIRAWESLRLGVVTLAEKFGGREVSDDTFEAMIKFVVGGAGAFFGARGGSRAMRVVSSPGNLRHRHHDRRRPSEFAALRSAPGRRAVAVEPRGRRGDRQIARDELRRNARPTPASATSAPIWCSPAARFSRRSGRVFQPSAFASPIAACARES